MERVSESGMAKLYNPSYIIRRRCLEVDDPVKELFQHGKDSIPFIEAMGEGKQAE